MSRLGEKLYLTKIVGFNSRGEPVLKKKKKKDYLTVGEELSQARIQRISLQNKLTFQTDQHVSSVSCTIGNWENKKAMMHNVKFGRQKNLIIKVFCLVGVRWNNSRQVIFNQIR